MKKTTYTKRIFYTYWLLTLFVSTFTSGLHAASPAEQTLRYAVDFMGQPAGEIEVVIKREGDEYLVTSISHPSLLAQMFLESYTLESRFSFDGEQLQLKSGKEILSETGEVQREFNVNHDNKVLSFSAGEPLNLPEGIRIEADSFPLLLMSSDLNTLAGQTYLSVSPKRARQYVYQEPEQESLSVPAGEFSTIKIVGVRSDSPDRKVNVWLNTGDDQIPVKITTSKDGRETTMTLME